MSTSDQSISSSVSPSSKARPASAARRKGALAARLLDLGTTATAILPLAALGAMLAVLLIEAIPAIRYNGWSFITSSNWSIGSLYGGVIHSGIPHLAGAHYGAAALIIGTLETSAIALVLGVPVAVGAAVILVEKLPNRIAGVAGLVLEVLAGVPSVVIGLWGLLYLGPFLAAHVYPTLAKLPNVPVLNFFRGNVGHGQGLLTAGLVLAAMIVPIVAATTRDLLRQVPETTKEGAVALGLTDTEVFMGVQARWVRAGIIGAAILGLGRALGETIAIALVSGSQITIASNIYATATSLAATIVSQLDSAQADPSGLAVKALAEAALVLLLITLLVNVVARVVVKRSARGAALPVGAGL